jgi:transposase
LKFINKLSLLEIETLTACLSNHHNHRVRIRAHSILLSNKSYTINQLADIFMVQRDAVSMWLNLWDKIGLAALFDAPRSGRPSKLPSDGINFIKTEIEIEPRSPKRVAARVKEKFGIAISDDTVKRVLRDLGKKWKRVRTSLKPKQDPVKFSQAQHDITQLQLQHKIGDINLTYFDASGFSLKPAIPYAWQDINKNILLNAEHSARYNVLGFMSYECKLSSYVFSGKTDSDSVIASFDSFSVGITKPTWVVLDNASVHTSAKFKANIDKWKQLGLNLYFLPPYSPELNLIEILWRFIKYKWLSFSAYLSPNNLQHELNNVLKNVGLKYKITFA